MNKLDTADRVRVISALVEGCSIRATVRMTGVAKNTIVKLLAEIGAACEQYHNEHVCHLSSKRIQCDEIWNFCYAKEKNVPADKKGVFGFGDCWTWTAIDADSKLMVSYLVGRRDQECANYFMHDLAWRLDERIQLTTDGHGTYWNATMIAFDCNIDFAQLIKIYGPDLGGQGKYSPAECTGCKIKPRIGNPDPKHVSTSYVERQNLTMRMGMRRFTRLTNGFSKKIENLQANIALHFMHYNFCRVHQTLRVTPAMEAKITDHIWEIEELVGLLG